MARSIGRARHPVSEAVIRLRQAYGETQQQFAHRMEVAIATIARYETSRPPNANALMRFARMAEILSRADLATTFYGAIRESGNDCPTAETIALQTLLDYRGRIWLQEQLETLLQDAKCGLPLSYPACGTQSAKIHYMEKEIERWKRRAGAETPAIR